MSNVCIPQNEWQAFLSSFSGDHYHRAVRIETHDLQTGEIVMSSQLRLRSIDYDLEDVTHPRINVNVEMDNKVIKEILFMPTELSLLLSGDRKAESLHVRSVNTSTTIHIKDGQR